jgi:hypothetical protein
MILLLAIAGTTCRQTSCALGDADMEVAVEVQKWCINIMSSVSYVGPVKVAAPSFGDSAFATFDAADEEEVAGLIWP